MVWDGWMDIYPVRLFGRLLPNTQQANEEMMDTSTYGGITARTNIKISISRRCALYDSFTKPLIQCLLAGNPQVQVPGHNITFSNNQCYVLKHSSFQTRGPTHSLRMDFRQRDCPPSALLHQD